MFKRRVSAGFARFCRTDEPPTGDSVDIIIIYFHRIGKGFYAFFPAEPAPAFEINKFGETAQIQAEFLFQWIAGANAGENTEKRRRGGKNRPFGGLGPPSPAVP